MLGVLLIKESNPLCCDLHHKMLHHVFFLMPAGANRTDLLADPGCVTGQALPCWILIVPPPKKHMEERGIYPVFKGQMNFRTQHPPLGSRCANDFNLFRRAIGNPQVVARTACRTREPERLQLGPRELPELECLR